MVPPRFYLVAAVFRPESLLMIFFQGKRLHIAEDGHRRPARGPTRQGAHPGGRVRPPTSWMVAGPPLVVLSPNIFMYSENNSRGVSGLLEMCIIGL